MTVVMGSGEQPPHTIDDRPPTELEMKFIERSSRGRKFLGRLSVVAFIAELVYQSGYQLPISLEEQQLADTHPSLIETSSGSDPSAETIVVGGFGVKNAAPIAEALTPLTKIGSVEALDEDQNGIDIAVIAQDIINQAKKEKRTSINLWGDSVGGLIVTKIARIIQESPGDITVNAIFLDCTPISVGDLRSDKRKWVNDLNIASTLLPDITLYPPVDYLYTSQHMPRTIPTISNSDERFSLPRLVAAVNDPNSPSTNLLASQVNQVVNPTFEDDLKAISKVTTKRTPAIYTIQPKNNSADEVVNSTEDQKDIGSIVKSAGLSLTSIKLPNIIHGDPTFDRIEYQRAITNIIIPTLAARDTPPQVSGNFLHDTPSPK